MLNDDDEIVQAFLAESAEGLDELDRDLVELERDPQGHERIAGVFRTIHSIKGTSGFLALGRLEELTHVGEELLSRLRDGELAVSGVVVEALLRMVDAVRALLDSVARTGSDEDAAVDLAPVLAELRAAGTSGAAPVPAEEPGVEVVAEPVAEVVLEPVVEPVPETVVEPVVPPVAEPVAAAAPAAGEPAVHTEATVRVDVDLLDTLVRLVGELVLARNQIVQQAGALGDADLARAAQRLNVVASELQENVMLTRMQPIGQAWTKFPRVVRDLATQLGKSVRLECSGQETELDRSLLDAVKDPLTHLVRNAIDHGLEPAAERVARGKPEQGVLALRAYHESGQVVVEVADDGRGLDAERIGAVATRRGVVSAAELARLTEREVYDLVFRPGFSTADAVTNVSGRGVGMDVVRTNIERIGGVVDISSRPGRGTTVRVRIPLTLAIIPALVVGGAGERFAVPQANLVELVRVEDPATSPDVSRIGGAALLRLRDHLLPLVALSEVLRLPADRTDARPDATVVVVQADGVRFGLVVDEVHDTQEIVVKPLGRQLKHAGAYAGATIMGEGRVALILDVAGIAETAGVGQAAAAAAAGDTTDGEADATTALLVLDLGGGQRAAMPLATVSRLEEFAATDVERSGALEAVRYRGGILPLVRLADRLGVGGHPTPDDGVLPVVVHEDAGRRVGLVAHRVLDLVETVVVENPAGRRPGVLGTAIVQDRITDLVDVDAVVAIGAGR